MYAYYRMRHVWVFDSRDHGEDLEQMASIYASHTMTLNGIYLLLNIFWASVYNKILVTKGIFSWCAMRKHCMTYHTSLKYSRASMPNGKEQDLFGGFNWILVNIHWLPYLLTVFSIGWDVLFDSTKNYCSCTVVAQAKSLKPTQVSAWRNLMEYCCHLGICQIKCFLKKPWTPMWRVWNRMAIVSVPIKSLFLCISPQKYVISFLTYETGQLATSHILSKYTVLWFSRVSRKQAILCFLSSWYAWTCWHRPGFLIRSS